MFVDILPSHLSGLVFPLTSRQPVALPGECVLPVLPMPSPDADSSEQDSDALALFAVRPKAALPPFGLHDDNQAEVIALCRRLNGSPLVIELAAVRLRTMPLEQILGRLDDRFKLLSGVRTAQARHHALRATIDWSHDLCSAPEQELWARLSVFADELRLITVEEVGSGGELADLNVLNLLGALVNKSVPKRMEGITEYRYRMLDTTREYCAERAESSGRAEEYARRHPPGGGRAGAEPRVGHEPRHSRRSGAGAAGGEGRTRVSDPRPPRAVGAQLPNDRAGARAVGGRQARREPVDGVQGAALDPSSRGTLEPRHRLQHRSPHVTHHPIRSAAISG